MRRSAQLAVALALTVQVAACANGEVARRPDTVAVLPLASVGTTPGAGPALRGEMTEALDDRTGATVVEQKAVDAAVDTVCGTDQDRWECLDKNTNLLRLGRELDVSLIVAGQLAAMGDRHALKLRVADVETQRISTETLNTTGSQTEPFLTGLLDLHARHTPSDITPTPWYGRWETWAIAGASVVVVAGAVVTGVLLSNNAGNGTNPFTFDFEKILP